MRNNPAGTEILVPQTVTIDVFSIALSQYYEYQATDQGAVFSSTLE